jgi:predicted RNase H-like HicB family nuclease
MGKRMKKEFDVIIEKDEDGYYHARVPELPGCFTQAESLREVNKNIKEAIDLYLDVLEETKSKVKGSAKFIAVKKVVV